MIALHQAVEAQGLLAAAQGRWIVRLTWALVILTLVIAALTGMLVWGGE